MSFFLVSSLVLRTKISYPFSFFGYGSAGMQSQQISENLVGFLPQENLTFLQLLPSHIGAKAYIYSEKWNKF